MSNEMETRTVNAPRTGTKVSLLLAAASLAVAVYYYLSTTHFTGRDGGIFGCGSAMSPNNAALGKEQCHIVESENLHKAFLFLALALILAILGTLLFGMTKSTQARGAGTGLEDEALDDDDDVEDEHREPRSGFLSGRQERQERGSKKRKRRISREDDDAVDAFDDPFDDEDDDTDDVVDGDEHESFVSKRTKRAGRNDDDPLGRPKAKRMERRVSRYDDEAFDHTKD